MLATIRRRTDADLDACIQLLAAVNAKDGYPVEGISGGKAFLGPGPAWVAEMEGRIIGHVGIKQASMDDVSVALWWKLHPGDRVAVLGRLMVHPGVRGAGIASKLIEAGTLWARDNQRRLVLFGLPHNTGALQLYQKLGWHHYGNTTHTFDGREWTALCYSSPELNDIKKSIE
ncbi:putative GNAT domain, acyl-CoA N-acyltransferase [Acrodontium crateriforme]|uniref:GNAT domain, acyl-CoA N-acyltransferase n=1 Tax=Acrodontium crateriforme TaxID=150365 RepID=A0AAQ3R8N0_9PEZI|nr:putative GNAT domain, acyl-CoA N-acyltransferase [Acrodontium crateriforme]